MVVKKKVSKSAKKFHTLKRQYKNLFHTFAADSFLLLQRGLPPCTTQKNLSARAISQTSFFEYKPKSQKGAVKVQKIIYPSKFARRKNKGVSVYQNDKRLHKKNIFIKL
jgi:hypothetical protein